MGLASDLAKFAEKTKRRTADVHREVVIQIANSLVTGSAVGNPSLWKSPAPAGYVGGAFRANWVPGIDQVNTAATNAPGTDAQAAIAAAIPAPGGVFYITNSLPYARRLEYDSWSTQMPEGVVRITALRFNEWLAKAIANT